MVDTKLGYSLWADFIERDFLETTFREWIERGVINGATSNPAIFKQAFTTSPAYDDQKKELAGKSAKEIYETLAVTDIRRAADLLRPLYDAGNDGFVSIEVDPLLCDDTRGTIAEGKRLWETIDRPNIMIKVPATEAGYEAMAALMAEGIPVNATLIFSIGQARRVVEAFKKGGCKGAGVVSVFVSRFDRKADPMIADASLKGKLGVLNAAQIYAMIEAENLPSVRTLFASTGVKGDDLPAAYYMTELLGAHCVNTAPVDTIRAFLEAAGQRDVTLPRTADETQRFFDAVSAFVDRERVCDELMAEGLDAFKIAFREIMASLQ